MTRTYFPFLHFLWPWDTVPLHFCIEFRYICRKRYSHIFRSQNFWLLHRQRQAVRYARVHVSILHPLKNVNKGKAVLMRSKSQHPQSHRQRHVGRGATYEGNIGTASLLTKKNLNYLRYGRQRASIIFLWCPSRHLMTPHLKIPQIMWFLFIFAWSNMP